MYAITDKNTDQWVTESCAGIEEWKESDTHFTSRIDKAAIFHDRGKAYRTMKKIEKRFPGHSFKTSKLTV